VEVWQLFEPPQTVVLVGLSLLFAAGSLAFSIAGAVFAMICGLLAYSYLGAQRRSVLVLFPSLLSVPAFFRLGIVAPTFEWGRRTDR